MCSCPLLKTGQVSVFWSSGFLKQTSVGNHYRSWVLAWFFSFPVVLNSSKSRIKAEKLVLLQLVCAAPQELAVAMGAAVQWPAPASFWEGGAEEELLAPWAQKSPKLTCLSLEVTPKCQGWGISFRSRINKPEAWPIRIRNLVWHIVGDRFWPARGQGWRFCCPSQLSAKKTGLGFGLFCWIQYEKLWEIKAAAHGELFFLVRLFWQNLDKSKDCV